MILGINLAHKHTYKKVGYYVMTYSSYGQDVRLYTRLQCSCGKHKKTRLIKKIFVFSRDLDKEIERLREIGYVSIEELERKFLRGEEMNVNEALATLEKVKTISCKIKNVEDSIQTQSIKNIINWYPDFRKRVYEMLPEYKEDLIQELKELGVKYE